jgi:sialate O-acetylesterase
MNPYQLLGGLLLAASFSAGEELTLNPLIADHMVMQRNAPVRIQGQAAPGAQIRATLAGFDGQGVADKGGNWSIMLPIMPEGRALTLTVSDGTSTRSVSDILVGDVWLCSGQSNMQWPVGKSARAAEELAAANHPKIRLLTMPSTLSPKPRTVPSATTWQVCNTTSVAGFSAVGYFFARDVQTQVDVPIGLINASWGGTPIQGWMSRESLQALQLYPEELALLARTTNDPEAIARLYVETLAAWWPKVDPGISDPAGPWHSQASGTWTPIEVGQAWEGQGLPDFDGILWYRCTFDAPPTMLGSAGTLDLGRVDDWDTTWINGRQIGAELAHTTLRRYAVPADLLKPTGNVLAVRVLDYGMGGGILDFPVLKAGGVEIPLRTGWIRKVSAAKDAVGDQPLRLDRNIRFPTQLFNGLIAPLGSLPLKGVLWYQGESNAGEPELYKKLLPAMIADWRQRFASPTLPFGIVQLANRQAPQRPCRIAD